MRITDSHLYNHLQCPHRPVLDASLPLSTRDELGAFAEMLWAQGAEFTKEQLGQLGVTADLSEVPLVSRALATVAALKRGEALIYGAQLVVGKLVSTPCLLERQPGGGYVPVDIRAANVMESNTDGDTRLKALYAVPMAHAVALLERLGFGDGTHTGFVHDLNGERIAYELDRPRGTRDTQTWMAYYEQTLTAVECNLSVSGETLPALGAGCKLCHWKSRCEADVLATNDLSLIPELGRSKRDGMRHLLPTVKALAVANINSFRNGKSKTVFPGVGIDSLKKFQERAKLISTPGGQPYLKSPVELPKRNREVYFDIESDPFKRNFVYLHGFVDRDPSSPVTAGVFTPFFADGVTAADEEAVFAAAWSFLTERLRDSTIYHYSQFEVTAYRQLARKYPGICSVEDVRAVFHDPAVVDLFAVVKHHTVWPCYDFSIKTLATFSGFRWRDESPSGANSVEWYRRWLETGDEDIKRRILEYNADDNFATGYVVDRVRQLDFKAAA